MRSRTLLLLIPIDSAPASRGSLPTASAGIMTALIDSDGRVSAANRVLRAHGQVEELGHIGAALMEPGDVFEISTPGGGGFG
eukprot:gene47490-63667_t